MIWHLSWVASQHPLHPAIPSSRTNTSVSVCLRGRVVHEYYVLILFRLQWIKEQDARPTKIPLLLSAAPLMASAIWHMLQGSEPCKPHRQSQTPHAQPSTSVQFHDTLASFSVWLFECQPSSLRHKETNCIYIIIGFFFWNSWTKHFQFCLGNSGLEIVPAPVCSRATRRDRAEEHQAAGLSWSEG